MNKDMKKTIFFLIAGFAVLSLLTGCGSFDNEYVVIHDYSPAVNEPSSSDGKITVRNFAALKQALLDMAYDGKTEGTIVFDAAYDGDTTEDMASACWSVRTQDALCAYCVENIAYELNKIVTINEASVYISYSSSTESAADIRRISFSAGVDNALSKAMSSGTKRFALLIGHSELSAEDMAGEVIRVYRETPTLVPTEPLASVNMYSGTGSQRLYEISINYGMTADEMDERMAQLRAVDAFADMDTSEMSEAQLAYRAMEYLAESCVISSDAKENNAYSALIGGSANSEGMALAYVVLCRQLNLDCQIVYGQLAWQEHCWNIVRVDGSCYHVDICQAIAGDPEAGFLRNDEQFWGDYRWDVASYPKCVGEFHYSDIGPNI